MENVTIIPDFVRNAKNGDFLTTEYGYILLVDHVEIDERSVRVYDYFYYDPKEDAISMNEWLKGFFGPKFTEDFYRPSTDEEKRFLLGKMEERGYRWDEGIGHPVMTIDEFYRINEKVRTI